MILAIALVAIVSGAPELERFSTEPGAILTARDLSMQITIGQSLTGTASNDRLRASLGYLPARTAPPEELVFGSGFEK
ncbi:MAG: hypothetical protein AAGA95_06880 [Pseudomonadota bacterium]